MIPGASYGTGRYRQSSSTATSALTSSTSESEGWMEGHHHARGSRGTSHTSRSLFSDVETEVQKVGEDETDVGTVVDHDRPLIDLDDTYGVGHSQAKLLAPHPVVENAPTPGEKLRMLLRQMEAEVRSTTNATTPSAENDHHAAPARSSASAIPSRHRRMSSASASGSASSVGHARVERPPQGRSNWRQGRRIGALPMERKYTPPSSPEVHRPGLQGGGLDEQEEEEEEEVLDDSPPTPPLRITNPYLYASRRVSDERRTSTSPRQTSRAAVLHASTSRSPPTPPTENDPHPSIANPTPLQSYLARTPMSPSRKGKERASPLSPTSPARVSTARKPLRTPRKLSVELAADDSVLFAEGLEAQVGAPVELDLDESADPPWLVGAESDTEASTSASGSGSERGDVMRATDQTVVPRADHDQSRDRSSSSSRSRNQSVADVILPELPELPNGDLCISPELDADARLTEDESLKPPSVRPPSRTRSRFSQSPSIRQSHSTSSSSPSVRRTDYSSFTTAPALSPSTAREQSAPPPVEEISVPEPVIRLTPQTPPKQVQGETSQIGQTPRPPGAWLSASKPQRGQVRFSPFRQGHLPPSSPSRSADESNSADISIHRIKLSPAKSPSSHKAPTGVGIDPDSSFTQRLLSTISRRALPAPSTTLAEAQSALRHAAQASDLARRKVEVSQRQWLEALSVASRTAQMIRQGWSWTRWAWWISLEIMLLWGVFRVTMEYASISQYRLFDPSTPGGSGPSMALAIPLPSALSAFVIPQTHRRSGANFFDLLEQLELWKYLDKLGAVGNDLEDGVWGRARVPI